MDICEPQRQQLSASDTMRDLSNCSHSLSAVGRKEYQPSNTSSEAKQIEDALKQQAAMLAVDKSDKVSFLVAAEWKADRKLALVTRRVGNHFDVMGHEEGARLWLYAEEILLLLELSHAELWYGGVSMSIQQGYAMLLGSETGCRDIEFAVYKHLSYLGYRLLRHTSCPTQYELDIRLNQCSAKAPKKLVIEEKDITRVDRMPATLMEDDPAETGIVSSPSEEIVLPIADPLPATHLETTDQSMSRSPLNKTTPEPAEEMSDDKFPNEFVVLDEWTAPDERCESSNNNSASIVVDDDSEIIGVTLEAKEIADDDFHEGIVLKQKSHSDLAVVDEPVKPASPKDLAEICPQIIVHPAVNSDPVCDKLEENSPENIPIDENDGNDKPKQKKDPKDDACIFADLNAFLAEICPSPKQQEDISPLSNDAESDFIGVSGVDTSQTILNSLAEVGTSDTVDETADDSSDDGYGELAPGFNVVVRQNMCPVLLDIPEPSEESGVRKTDGEVQVHGKRSAEDADVGTSKRLRTDGEHMSIAKEPSAARVGGSDIASSSKEVLVNGDVADVGADSDVTTVSSEAKEDNQQACLDVSDSETSDDDDCLNIEVNRDELDSPVRVEDGDSDLEIIEMNDMEDLSVTISNKRKRTDDDVRCVKRRPVIEVVNLSDEDSSSAESDEESGNETVDLNPSDNETDVMSVASSSSVIEEPAQNRKKFWDPALLEDEDRTKILKSIVNVANKTQVDLTADWRYIPPNCNPVDRRVKVFRLNAIGIGGKPSVDYVPAHKVIEVRQDASDFLPLAAPSSAPSPFSTPPPTFNPPPLLNLPLANPWVQIGSQNFLPNFQFTVQNTFHQPPIWSQPPPVPWQQPSSAFIAPNNMGYAIPGSFAPPRFSPMFHVVHTPRMRNRTIRGVTKVVRPYENVTSRPTQGWFQQNNVFNEPNAIQVELPPPVKPEPWIPGVMQKMKDEVPCASVFTVYAPTVKKEGPCKVALPPSYDLANDNKPIGDYTVKKILDACRSKKTQKGRLRTAWATMLETKTMDKSTQILLNIFERKSPLLKGLLSNVLNALGGTIAINFKQPCTVVQNVAVKEEIVVGNAFGNVDQKINFILEVCHNLTPKQIKWLQKAIMSIAIGSQFKKPELKILKYVSSMLISQARKILDATPLLLDRVNAYIACLDLVWIPRIPGTVNPIYALRNQRLNELGLPRTAMDVPLPVPLPKPVNNTTASSQSVARIDKGVHNVNDRTTPIESGTTKSQGDIIELKRLSGNIEEWVNFPSPMDIAWKHTKDLLEKGDALSSKDYTVLKYAQTHEPRLNVVLPSIINKAYIGKDLKKPSSLGRSASDADWRSQMLDLVSVCPWLNALGFPVIDSVKKGMQAQINMDKELYRHHKDLMDVSDVIIRTVKHILRADQQPSDVVDTLILWANYLNMSGSKYSGSQLSLEIFEEGASQSNEMRVANQMHSVDGVSEKSNESTEETNLETSTSSESSGKDSSGNTSSSVPSPNDAPPDGSKHLKALVADVMAWLTLSEEQNEMWKRAKERMANDEAFTAEDIKLFRFAASQDERLREIEHLLEIEQADKRNREDTSEMVGVEEESSDESRDSSHLSICSEEEVVEPLLKPSDCTDYASVIAKLGIIKSAAAEFTSDRTVYKISYDLYLPAAANEPPFRKSNPGVPDYRIVVLRPEDHVPGAGDVSALRQRCCDQVPVLFAIVRTGTVSFLRLDAVQLPTDLTEYGHETVS